MQTRRSRSKNAIDHLSSVLQPLVDSASLGACEIGRIAQTCKKMNQACEEDSIWASFCQREYPATRCFSKSSTLQEEFKGYRSLYKSWTTPVVKRRPPAETLGPPSCRSIQQYLAIDVKYNGKSVYAKLMNIGTKLGTLLETGSVKIKVSSNVSRSTGLLSNMTFGKAVWDYGPRDKALYERSSASRQFGLPVKSDSFDPSNLDLRIHLYRTHDHSFSCLFSSQDPHTIVGHARALMHPEDPENITLQSKFDLTREQKRIYFISFKQAQDGTENDDGSIRGWPLEHTHQATLIMQAFPHPLYLLPQFGFSVLENGDFAVSRIALHVMTKEGNAKPRKFKSKQETGNHGVTLQHVFSELQGT